MQIKTTVRYHLTPVRITIIKGQVITSIGENAKKKEPSCTAGGTANWYGHYGKQYRDSSKTKN